MINYYKSNNNNELIKLNEFENGCWINLTNPTQEEIIFISNSLNIDIDTLKAPLDEDERSRIQAEDNHTLILIDIPIDESNENSTQYTTIPLGIILLDESIITICTNQTKILNDFISSPPKDFFTYMRTRFLLQILYKNSSHYLACLRKINNITSMIEKEIYNSMKNKELIQLLELEKSLIHFSTSLKAIELVLNKLPRTSSIKKYEDDKELLEDVIVENRQALEMATIYGDILSRVMDAFSAIISNNQNNAMQFLTVVTLILSIPTIISGLFGMNVAGIPFSTHLSGFWIVIMLTCIICLFITLYFARKKFF